MNYRIDKKAMFLINLPSGVSIKSENYQQLAAFVKDRLNQSSIF